MVINIEDYEIGIDWFYQDDDNERIVDGHNYTKELYTRIIHRIDDLEEYYDNEYVEESDDLCDESNNEDSIFYEGGVFEIYYDDDKKTLMTIDFFTNTSIIKDAITEVITNFYIEKNISL